MQHVEKPPIRILTRWLGGAPQVVFIAYAIFAAFWTYFCMYAFRKPFLAAAFEGDGLELFGRSLDLKTVFVVAQIVGYCISKYLGMKICSEVKPRWRFAFLIGSIVTAWTALLLFAILPGFWKIVAIFINGLPLGMVWGLVVRYLEGRTSSELLLAGLSCAYIVSSGIVKSVGRWLMVDHGVSEFWMPFATGALFLVPFILATWLLNQIPVPTETDVAARTERPRMHGADRWRFLKVFLPGMIMLCVAYFFLTAYRDYRDNYMLEIYGHFIAEELIADVEAEGALPDDVETELRLHLAETDVAEDERAAAALQWMQARGVVDAAAAERLAGDGRLEVQADAFARTDLPVGFAVLVPLALLTLVRDNRRGMLGAYLIMIAGLVLMGGGTLLLQAGMLSAYHWMVLIGIGAYLAYVPYGSVLFDRTIAATHFVGTAVFAIYLTDAIGYTGSVGMQLYKDFFAGDTNRGEFFIRLTWFMAIFGTVLMIGSAVYFMARSRFCSTDPESA